MHFYFRLLFRKLVHMLTHDFLEKNLIPLNLNEQIKFFQRLDVRSRMDRILEQINVNPSVKRINECIRNDKLLCEIIEQYVYIAEIIRDEDIETYPVRVLEFDESIFQ